MRGHVAKADDFFHRGTLLQDICRAIEANEDGSNRRHVGNVDQQLVGDVRRVEIRKNQDIGVAVKFAEWKLVVSEGFIQGNVGLHFPVHAKVRMTLLENSRRLCNLVLVFVPGGTEARKTEHRKPDGFFHVALGQCSRGFRNLDQLFCRWIDVDRAIRQKE